MSLGQIFDSIYKTGFWKDKISGSPLSGSGSSPENAKPYVDFVHNVVLSQNLKRVLDIGHGDFEMWRDWPFTGIDYLGVDISSEATKLAESNFPEVNLRFTTLDFTQTEFVPVADLLLSKDCLQHLPNEVVLLLLQKFASYRHLIICNDVSVNFNSKISLLGYYLRPRSRIKALLSFKSPFFFVGGPNNGDIQAGGHRCINLEIEPFVGALAGHELVESFDYDGPPRAGIKKRVYHYQKNLRE